MHHQDSGPLPATRVVGSEGYVGVDGNPRKKRRVSPWKVFGVVVLVLVAVLGAGAVWAITFIGQANFAMRIDDPSLSGVLDPVAEGEPFYALLLGSDAREKDEAARSDTIILVRVDSTNKTATLVSIPRDTMVELPGHGTQKINAAHAFGGISGAVEAVEDFAGVDISHVAEVDFSGLSAIVDALDGVTVNVPPDTTVDDVTLPEGEQTLNGEQALVFARCRKTYAEGDYQRAANQRTLIMAICKKILASSPTEIPALVQSLTECIKTDMDVTSIVSLAIAMRGMDTEDGIVSCVVPSEPAMVDGISYVLADEGHWAEMMEIVDAGGDPNEGYVQSDAGMIYY